MPQQVDTLIHARWVVPVEPDCTAREEHTLAIDQGNILELLPSKDAAAKYQASQRVELNDHVLMPGLVNSHTHAAMTLFRGFADDLPLMNWLQDHIWPAEKRWVDQDFVLAGTRLAIAEMIRSGTTCFNDMYYFPDVVAQACQDAGMRACVGLIVLDFPTAWAQDASDYLRKATQVHDDWRDSELISTAFAPHAPYTVSDAPLGKIKVLADELDLPVHIHVHETAQEIEDSMRLYNMRPLERLSRLGLLNDRLVAVHATQLMPAEITSLAANGASVVHCPESNLKLASGMCSVAALCSASVNVALGTDSAASNNDLDMLGEAKTAALLAKGVSRDPTALPVNEVITMATLNGARALRLDHRIGSLLPGKSADIIAVDLGDCGTQPTYDPLPQLVYSAARNQVTDVWINGNQVLRDRACTSLDLDTILTTARTWAQRVQQQSTLVN